MSALKTFSTGDVLSATLTSAVSSGDVVELGDCIGIALADYAANAEGQYYVEGIFEFKIASATTASVGDKLMWDTSAGQIASGTAASGDIEDFGVAAQASASGDTSVLVKLTPGAGTAKA